MNIPFTDAVWSMRLLLLPISALGLLVVVLLTMQHGIAIVKLSISQQAMR